MYALQGALLILPLHLQVIFFQLDFVYIACEMTVLARAMDFDVSELYINWVVLSMGPSPYWLYDSASSYTLDEWDMKVHVEQSNMMKFWSCLKNLFESRTDVNEVLWADEYEQHKIM